MYGNIYTIRYFIEELKIEKNDDCFNMACMSNTKEVLKYLVEELKCDTKVINNLVLRVYNNLYEC